jgi:hypothetical protein
MSNTELIAEVHIVLVTCVKSKGTRPAAAKDLYTSALFRKEPAYAERIGVPWFILSAEHGVVAPDEWLAPYERYIADTSASYRSAWGAWGAARLDLLAGPITDKVVEIHAGSTYLDALRPHLERLGARVVDPLHGLSMGQRLAWYGSIDKEVAEQAEEPGQSSEIVEALRDGDSAISPKVFAGRGKATVGHPGLYSWWVDQAGADDLSRGLGLTVECGLIYAGLAGATRWPSGKRSKNTLWSRVMTMHLGGNYNFSTFRLTLGSILAGATGAKHIDEVQLTQWMNDHLRVVTIPFENSDALGRLERDVLERLDPPLNLQRMQPTPVRDHLKELRRVIANPATPTAEES